jgi:hypothetical protein
MQLDRYEAKYIVPPALVPRIREFIRPFCNPDPHGEGDPPEYMITTLQLDTPALSFHHAKANEAVNRFKLRVRTYGETGCGRVFLEVKRKINGTIVKSRSSVPASAWGEKLLFAPKLEVAFASRKEEDSFLEFRRLAQITGARPTVCIRYIRESYFGRNDHYARVTFDRKLQYRPAPSWELTPAGARWFSMDTPLVQNKDLPGSGVVLELKTLSSAPTWMIDLVQQFGLVRTGNCKYSTAINLESLFRGTPAHPNYAGELFAE